MNVEISELILIDSIKANGKFGKVAVHLGHPHYWHRPGPIEVGWQNQALRPNKAGELRPWRAGSGGPASSG
jgi:hypothetical protein